MTSRRRALFHASQKKPLYRASASGPNPEHQEPSAWRCIYKINSKEGAITHIGSPSFRIVFRSLRLRRRGGGRDNDGPRSRSRQRLLFAVFARPLVFVAVVCGYLRFLTGWRCFSLDILLLLLSNTLLRRRRRGGISISSSRRATPPPPLPPPLPLLISALPPPPHTQTLTGPQPLTPTLPIAPQTLQKRRSAIRNIFALRSVAAAIYAFARRSSNSSFVLLL